VSHLFGSNKGNNPMIKLIVGAGEVLVFLLILVACGCVVYLGIRLWDKERARRMVPIDGHGYISGLQAPSRNLKGRA
jgi:hypothetical protein